MYMASIEVARRHVYMWPPMEQIDTIGSKHRLLRHLDEIAKAMHTVRPKSKVLKRGDQISGNIVLKRSHSDSGLHVIMPHEGGRDWHSLQDQMEIPGCVWIGQTFVPELDEVGEWRVFFVGGRIIYCVHTKYHQERQTWKYESVTEYYSLDEMTYVFSLILLSYN